MFDSQFDQNDNAKPSNRWPDKFPASIEVRYTLDKRVRFLGRTPLTVTEH